MHFIIQTTTLFDQHGSPSIIKTESYGEEPLMIEYDRELSSGKNHEEAARQMFEKIYNRKPSRHFEGGIVKPDVMMFIEMTDHNDNS